jgi:uncharacterized protein
MTSLPEDQQHDPLMPPQDKQPAASEAGAVNEPNSADWPALPAHVAPTGENSGPVEPTETLFDEIDPAAVHRPLADVGPAAEPMFRQYEAPPPPPERIPNFGHLCLLGLLVALGLVFTGIVTQIALHNHLFGISTAQNALSDIHYTLGSEALLYIFTLAECLIVFPLVWRKGFFAGVQWNAGTAFRLRWRLFSAAGLCFLLAFVDSVVVPGPKNAPIEKIFHSPGAAWLLFAFGITFAPFFEEIFFRGFLLPALCTAFDWLAEKFTVKGMQEAWSLGRPRWSARVITWVSLIFASAVIAAACAFFYLHGISTWLFLLAYVLGLTLFLVFVQIYGAKSTKSRLVFVDRDHPVWSFPALIIGSIATSIPFAAMHGEQTGYSIGPFLLLVAVSLVLCAVRLSTRSLAASTMVHASYNFMLFAIMLIGTQGFRHLDKM